MTSYVNSFNTRQGDVTLESSDVTNALGYTPIYRASVLDFGADPTGVNNSTTAFNNALAHPNVFIPDGNYLLDNLVIPASCMSLVGQSEGSVTLTPSSSVTSGNFISYNGTNPIVLNGFTISATASGVTPLQVQNANHPRVSEITVNQSTGAAHAIVLDSCSYGDVSKCYIPNPGANGIQILNCTGCATHDNFVLSPISIMHCIQVYGGTSNLVYGNYCQRTSSYSGFCISIWQSDSAQVVGNNLVPNSLEGVNLDSSSNCIVSSNLLNCAAGHHDFGISVYSDTNNCSQNMIVGNFITGCGKAGVAFASSNSYTCSASMASENLIVNPCQNQLSGEPHAALYVYGNASAELITIQNNNVIDGLSNVNYICLETDGNNNIYKDNVFTAGAIIAENSLSGSGSKSWDTIFSIFDATVSSTSGSIATASATVKYRRRGTVADLVIDATISNNGTGAGVLKCNLPVSCTLSTIAGREMAVTGYTVMVMCDATTATFFTYDNAYPALNGAHIVASGIIPI